MPRDKEIVIVDGLRTPYGSFGGSLKEYSATDLAVESTKTLLEISGISPEAIEHIIFGNVVQTSPDAAYLARHVGLRSGIPKDVPAVTINRLCGSGFETIIDAARHILLGEEEVILAGGTESMSQAPHSVWGARWGDMRLSNSKMVDILWTSLTDSYCGCSMAETAENLAEKYDISREACDEYAYRSQMAAHAAWEEGRMQDEVFPVNVKTKKGEEELFLDEHIRPDTSVEKLAKLSPYFSKDGTVTAGNASGICDGSASVIVTTAERAEKEGWEPIGRLHGWGVAGVEPSIMGIGPVAASKKVFESTGYSLDDMALIEVNEAFAPQYLAVEKALGLDREITNVNGGAIAVGHPLASSGTRLTITILKELKRRGEQFGLAAACIGGGQGAAVIVEAL
ncbi:MAG: acetyl-CoA C-acetyltransferase [Candidatus Marinimicrobia bacterium]|nr:acetyl-CoA C-acetyltransferase [Candidatus Neomarinimicrobiota bacterium]MCF7827671.1 acetyl-CoA C-acetyltransferase [Candidatus Neomarinimicrobiota bacterium]MCF7881274.1 acetyl-CoA C-acetyltransferase [Candidatus Neomarinimicrobiota bacterium]